MTNRRAEDYPEAYENSLDAQSIVRMLERYKRTLAELALAQAQRAVEGVLGMLKRGEWLDERDVLMAQPRTFYVIQLNDAPVAVADNTERAAAMADAIRANEGQHKRFVYVREFKLNVWPEHWAGKDS